MSSGQSLEIAEQGAITVVEIGLAGAPGTKGPPGTSWLDGHGDPAPGLGLERDHYLDHDTGNVWAKSAIAWARVGNLTGPQGDQGDQGDKGDTGDITPELQAARDEAVAAATSAGIDAGSAGQSAASAAQSMGVAQQAAEDAVGAAVSATQSAGAAAADRAAAADSAGAAGAAAGAAAGSAAAASDSALQASQARAAAEDARDRAEAAAQGLAFDGDYNSLRNKPNLALKADKMYVDEGLGGKADAQATTTALGLKADKTYVDEGLSGKADAQATTDALALKAAKTYVDTGLGNKLDKAANLSDVASAASARANLSLYSKAEIVALGHGTYETRNVVGATASPTTITLLSASYIRLVRADGTTVRVAQTGPLTASIALAGPAPLGRDQAAAFPDGSWLYVWYIYRDDTQVLSVTISLSSTAPALSANVTAWALAGTWRLGAPQSLVSQRWHHKTAYYNYDAAVFGGSISTGGAETGTMTPYTVFVPPIAVDYRLGFIVAVAAASLLAVCQLDIRSLAGGFALGYVMNQDANTDGATRYIQGTETIENTGYLSFAGTFNVGQSMTLYARVRTYTIP